MRPTAPATLPKTQPNGPSGLVPSRSPGGEAQTGSPGAPTAYVDEVQIDSHPLDVPAPLPEPPTSAVQENTTNYRPRQQVFPIPNQHLSLTGNEIISIAPEQPPFPLALLFSTYGCGTFIMSHVNPPIDLTATRDDATLKKIAEMRTRLTLVNKDMSKAIAGKNNYAAEKASIQWLFSLNRLTSSILLDEKPLQVNFQKMCDLASQRAAAANLLQFVTADVDVRLPNQPHAQRRRTEVLAQRLSWCANAELFKALLSKLFDHAKDSQGAVDHRTFIDLHYLALAALGVYLRPSRYGGVSATEKLIEHIVMVECEVLDGLPAHLSTAFEAEVDFLRRKALPNPFKSLDHDFPAIAQFMREACLFLDDPGNSKNERRETMISHLEKEDASWLPSDVQLLEALAGLDAAAGVAPLSGDQRIRIQRILTRYMETLCAMHTADNKQMRAVRDNLFRLPGAIVFAAFSELASDDKLKIANVRPDSYEGPFDLFRYLQELKSRLPVIRHVLRDDSIDIRQRHGLADGFLTELARLDPGALEEPIALTLMGLRDELAHIAALQAN